MAKRIVDKLVRDKILPQLESQGKTVKYRQLTDETEKKQKVIEKLGEKYKELFESLIRSTGNTSQSNTSPETITDSLADMLEIMNTIAHVWHINLQQVAKRKKQKQEEKGGYDTRTYIHHIEE